MATYDVTQVIPSSIHDGDILNCPYSGRVISLTLPKGIYKLECWGAQGGTTYNNTSSPGKGGYSVGQLSLVSGSSIYLYAGGQGSSGKSNSCASGGFNGGGSGAYNYGGGGGGASDIRINTDSPYARVIVAGAGGGACYYSGYNGAVGGGTSGGDGAGYGSYYSRGGTQTAGGAAGGYSYYGNAGTFGSGGSSNSEQSSYSRSGGGGSGWYGGRRWRISFSLIIL